MTHLEVVEGPMKAEERREALKVLALILERPALSDHHRLAADLAVRLIGRQINPLMRAVDPEADPKLMSQYWRRTAPGAVP